MAQLSREALRCLTGMFQSTCKSHGTIFTPDKNDDLMIGKYEVEENWRKTWTELKTAGYIDFTEEDVPTYDGKRMVYVHLSLTQKARDWREADLREWRRQIAEDDAREKSN